MSIELLNKEHFPVLMNSLQNTERIIRIVSPFIGNETSEKLINSIKERNVDCTLITRFYREDFLTGASKLYALKKLIEAGVKVYALKKLHSKLYIFDNNFAVIGSANFTLGGFRFNHELSLAVEEEPELIENLTKYFEELLKEIINSGEWLLTIEKVEDEIAIVEKLAKNMRDKKVKYSNNIQFGADIEEKEHAIIDNIENMIAENKDDDFKNGIWLKFEGTGASRLDSMIKYESVKINRNQTSITCFPRKPTGIANEDYIYLTALSYDKNNIPMPMITARARTTGYNSNNVVSYEHCKIHNWMSEYPFYCELYDIEILDVPILNCIALDSVLREIGSDTYPTTVGKKLTLQELKIRHHQKSHIRITKAAQKLIDSLFDALVSKYGVKRY